MQYDLIVWITDGEWEAQRVRNALQTMRKSPLLGVNHAVIAKKDSAGRVSVLQWRDLSNSSGHRETQVLDCLAELIFGEPGPTMLDDLAATGLDIDFLSLIGQKMQKNSSALFFLLNRDGLGDTGELLDALSLFRGKTNKTTLSEVTIATIQETNTFSSSSSSH